MYGTFCVSIFVVIIRLIFCEDECGPPHQVNRAKPSNPPVEGYVLGTTITYRCDYGFVVRSAAKTSRCVRDRETNQLVWTEPEFTCSPRSCEDPGSVENARRVGSRFTFPNDVEYVCNEGYTLSGLSRRYCEASGTWSGRLPSCNVISCERPEDPENGRAVYSSLTYNSELRYECNSDFQLSSKESRFCGQDGQWTGVKPVCREISCEMPDEPEFGSASLVGDEPKVGSIVVYKCNPGRQLVGSSSSTCLKIGEWNFPAPLCVEPCVTPSVANGELGKYEQEYSWRYGWQNFFKKVSARTTLEDNEKVILKCNTDYVPKSQPLREIVITCQSGQLTPEPECVSMRCLGEPPSIDNGDPVVSSRNHEHGIWYRCHSGFEKTKSGRVKCVYGSWVGETPTCGDTRCDKSSLNYPGLPRSTGFLLEGQSFLPTCLSGYEVTEKTDKKIYCTGSKWTGNLPPCTRAQCKTEDLANFSGLVLEGYRHLDDGEWFQPQCSVGFEFSNKLDSKVYCREGSWKGNLPPCSPAHCSNNPPVPENGRIKSFRAAGHGSSIEYECLASYEMVGKSSVVCNHGQWTGSPPTCRDTRCYLRNLREKDGVDLTDDSPTHSGQKANIVCIRGYNLRYPNVECENGLWESENLLSPCQENACKVNPIPNGKFLMEKNIPIRNFVGYQTGTKTVRQEVVTGYIAESGVVLYIECSSPYRFQGKEENEGQVDVTCRRGEWTPLPVCQLPGKPMTVEVDEETTSVPLPVLTPKLNDSTSTSANNSVQDPDGGLLTLDNNSTENGVGATDGTVNPPCSCKYTVQNGPVLAHDGEKLVNYGDEISSGSIIAFYCNTTGYLRLRGPPSLKCPEDCDWQTNLFPTCVGPGDEDVIINVFATPPENMKVGLGGVLSVIPGTRIQLACRVKTGYRQYVDWVTLTLANDGLKDGVTDFQKNIFTMHLLVPDASSRNSGKYTCFKSNTVHHTVDIEVRDVECPEIQSTKEMGVSYTDRKFRGQATFHCFYPYMRSGPSSVTCEASGLWSSSTPTCTLPTCSMSSIYDFIPEGVVPLVDSEIGENVPYGYELRLGCDEKGRVLKGNSTAVCSTNKWKTGGTLQCVRGCSGFQKKTGSELVISPDKEFYSMGESVTFSCPPEKSLTVDVERILCFSSGWTPDTIPDCQ